MTRKWQIDPKFIRILQLINSLKFMNKFKSILFITTLTLGFNISSSAQGAISCYTSFNLKYTTSNLNIDTCAGKINVSVTYKGSPSYIYWNDGYIGSNRDIDYSGKFQAFALDSSNQCADTTPVMKVNLSGNYLSVSTFPYSTKKISLCKGQDLTLYAYANVPFKWNTGDTLTSITVKKSGKYFAKTTSGKCSITSDTVYLTVVTMDNLKLKALGDTAFCFGDSVKIEASGGYGYQWTSGVTGKSSIYAKQSGEYYVAVTDTTSGCYFRSNSINIKTTNPIVQPLCIVVADSATGKNKIKWTPANPGATSAYYVYRETSTLGTFTKIATLNNSLQSEYVDSASTPKQRPYTYYVSILDTCGNEAEENRWYVHTTMHLTASLGVNGENNLTWTDYIGIYPINTYVIYRSNKNGPFTEIGSVATSIRSFSDLNPPSGNNRYAIGFKPDATCHSGSGSFAPGISNMVSFGLLSSSQNKIKEALLFPNPASGTIQIQNPETSNLAFTIADIQGKKIITGNLLGNTLNISSLASGHYLLSIAGYKTCIVTKL